MRTILINLVFIATLLTAGCSIYKVDIQQGNVIEVEQLAKVKVGMKKNQVTFLMGNPLLTDPFHANRWDYIFTQKPGGKATTRQLVTMYFEDDVLVKIDVSKLEKQVVSQ